MGLHRVNSHQDCAVTDRLAASFNLERSESGLSLGCLRTGSSARNSFVSNIASMLRGIDTVRVGANGDETGVRIPTGCADSSLMR
jgi:hypothetical protein